MIRHSKSLILVWQLAELEALNLKQDTIKPAHFLLGILKVVDIDLFKILEKQVEEVADEIRYDIVDLKSCLGEFVLDTTYTRRFLRGILPEGCAEPTPGGLRRAKSTRVVFGAAETLALKTSSPVLPIHLLLALLEAEDAHIKTALEKVQVDINQFSKFIEIFLSKPLRRCAG
jgi:ATP-dependent Clp protease ATP-binding subunit ClpA